jgi:hypothetical protein
MPRSRPVAGSIARRGREFESCRLEQPANVTNQICAVYKDLSVCNQGFRLADVDGLCRHTVG